MDHNMKNLTLYLRQEKVFYSIGSEKGSVDAREAESLVERAAGGSLNIIISKPDLVFRRIEFPFRSSRKAMMVISQELEDMLPESPSNFLYSLEPFRLSGGNIGIVVYAVKKSIVEYWENICLKWKAALSFFSDTVLLDKMMKRYTSMDSYSAVYGADGYLIVNISEKGRLSAAYSCLPGEEDAERVKEMLKALLGTRKDSRLFFMGDGKSREFLEGIPVKFEEIRIFENEGKEYLFPLIAGSSAYRQRPLVFKKISAGKKIPVSSVLFLLFFLASLFLSFMPYFRIPGRKEAMDRIVESMKSRFTETCPEVTRVVDPLVQVKEKISGNTSSMDTAAGHASILRIMEDTTSIFPEAVNVELEQFTVTSKNVSLAGRIESLRALEEAKERALSSRKFGSVNVGAISFDENNRVSFNMTLGIK